MAFPLEGFALAGPSALLAATEKGSIICSPWLGTCKTNLGQLYAYQGRAVNPLDLEQWMSLGKAVHFGILGPRHVRKYTVTPAHAPQHGPTPSIVFIPPHRYRIKSDPEKHLSAFIYYTAC